MSLEQHPHEPEQHVLSSDLRLASVKQLLLEASRRSASCSARANWAQTYIAQHAMTSLRALRAGGGEAEAKGSQGDMPRKWRRCWRFRSQVSQPRGRHRFRLDFDTVPENDKCRVL